MHYDIFFPMVKTYGLNRKPNRCKNIYNSTKVETGARARVGAGVGV